MITVDDCINNLNKENYCEKQLKNTKFCDFILNTKNTSLNSILGFLTVLKFEDTFYRTQSTYSKNGFNNILPELCEHVLPRKLITVDFTTLDIWDINITNSKKYIIFCAGIGSEKSNYPLQKAYLKLSQNGYGVIAFDYRGRGKSTGEFSQKGALCDVKTVHNYLKSKGIKPDNIGIIGHSMGTGVAADFSSRIKLAFTVLINPFSKAADMVKNIADKVKMPEIVRRAIKKIPSFLIPLKNSFDNEKALKNIQTPVFLLHTTNDKTIPVELARNLYNLNQTKPNVYYTELTDSDHEVNEDKIELCLNFIDNFK